MNDDKLDKILEKLDRIIDLLPREKPSYVPTYPGPNVLQQPLKCLECGIRLDQVMGYVCNSSQCPTYVRVTSAAYSEKHQWQTTNNEDK